MLLFGFCMGFAQSVSTFNIDEAGISFDLPGGWTQSGKTGKLEYGKVQFDFTHPHVQGEGRVINPSIFVIVDKSSWFKSEEEYLEEKLSFHKVMDDQIDATYGKDDQENQLNIACYFSIGTSGIPNDPYGQKLLLVTFWNEKCGFHLQIKTSKKHFESNQSEYEQILKSIRISN